MAINRIKKTKNFSIISNQAARIETLSLKAKGLFYYLMTLPDEWNVNVSELVNHSSDGRDSHRSAMKELEAAGFILKSRSKCESGKFDGWDYDVYEEPKTDNPSSAPSTEDGLTEFGEPTTSNRAKALTEEKQTTEVTVGNNLNSSDGEVKEKEEGPPALKEKKPRIKFEDTHFKLNDGSEMTYGSAADALGSMFIRRLTDSLGRKPACTKASCRKPLIKLLRNNTPGELRKIIEYVTTAEYVGDEFKPIVLSASALSEKIDRVILSMGRENEPTSQHTTRFE